MAVHVTTQKYKAWSDVRINLSADDISKIDPEGAKIRMLIRPNGDGYLIAGPELLTTKDTTKEKP